MCNVIHLSKALLATAACLLVVHASAQTRTTALQMPVDARTARVQEQAEEVYERNDFDRAFFIYRNELAPIGDKYGQYMVGFMYLTGKGVAEDRVRASAWYRLAAERDTEEFIRARDQLMQILDDAERAKSDQLFIELRKQYGDLVLIAKAIREDYEVLKNRTGSRLPSGSTPLTVVDVGGGGRTVSGAEYFGRIERRLQARLDYIAAHTEIDIVDLDLDKLDIDRIEQQIAARMARLD